MDEQQQTNMHIEELTAKLALLEAENNQLKRTQQSIAEVNNNYLMLHYLTSNIQDCQTTQELWETYLHNLSDCGFNYDHVALLLPDDNEQFTTKLTLEDCKLTQTTVAVGDGYIAQAITTKASATSPDNLKAAVPIVRKAGVVRALLLAEKASGIFFEDLQLLDLYVRQTAATIENIILNENLRQFQELLGRQLDQFVMLHYVTKAIHDAGNYYDVLANYLTTLCSPLGFGFQKGVLYIFAENKLQKASLEDEKLVVMELEAFEGQLINGVIKAKRYELSPDRSHLVMPLNSCGNITAVIEINHDKEITPEQIQMLEIFAMQTSSAIDNTRLKLHLEYLSFHDPLTSLYNRAYFEKEIQRIETESLYPAGIIICDLDGLKMVNDTWGHNAGDKFIVAAATIIKCAVPDSAVAARIGGDEFGIIITGNEAQTIEKAGLKLKHELERHNASLPDIPIGMSIGWAASAEPVEVIEIFKQADSQMYRDKSLHGKASREYILKMTKRHSDVRL
ncbi:sensor domain-containing diguanylate cyclase [Sporomusa malonica]|uniref:Diguanylate cyclase (GGDEF) domain-containing protein n=1 Tax=Sporomusa malonica TaxID=112901 RepID=A0A1W2BIN0_9FIRM|nr:sensor domain-containing diguanylate cyclase [Sporomusa malonica]SMC72620.1 diguanylate cyclase (GGDEF) domain-containing protein [Sporomusa malonica]